MRSRDMTVAQVSDDLPHQARSILAAAEREEWLSVKEYAALRRVHVQTVYSALRYRAATFPHIVERVGRVIRIYVPRESINERKAS